MIGWSAPFYIESNILTYLVAFIIIDLRLLEPSHSASGNFFWINMQYITVKNLILLCLETSISTFINLYFILIPAAFLGVPAKVITLPIQLFLQFWYHTKHIKKMGILEKIIVTCPIIVHHAINSWIYR
jgi:hypothetical protein